MSIIIKTHTMDKVLFTLAVYVERSMGLHAQQQEPTLLPAGSEQPAISR